MMTKRRLRNTALNQKLTNRYIMIGVKAHLRVLTRSKVWKRWCKGCKRLEMNNILRRKWQKEAILQLLVELSRSKRWSRRVWWVVRQHRPFLLALGMQQSHGIRQLWEVLMVARLSQRRRGEVFSILLAQTCTFPSKSLNFDNVLYKISSLRSSKRLSSQKSTKVSLSLTKKKE